MNYPPMNPYPPGMAAPPQKSNTVLFIVLAGAGLLVLLAIVGIALAFKSGMNTSSEAVIVGNKFIDAMGQHNFPASSALLSPQTQGRIPATELRDMETLLERQHGAFVSHGPPAWFVQNYNGQTSVRLTYQAQFTRGTSPIMLVMVKGDHGYEVNDCHYEL